MHRVLLNRKPPAVTARLITPAVDGTKDVPPILPDREPPVVPAQVLKPATKRTNQVRRVVSPPLVLPQAPAAYITPDDLEPDQDGMALPHSPEFPLPGVPQKGSLPLAGRSLGSSIKRIFARTATPAMPAPRQKSGYNGFLKEWVLPTILITAVFFFSMEYLVKNYQARASGSPDQVPQATVIALGERISQAESTISALQNSIAVQQNPTLAQAALPPAQIDLSKTLLLGPLDGSLVHSNDGLVKTFWAEQDTKNFTLNVVLVNPYPASFHPWDTCIRFRRVYTDEYRLTIFSTQQWTLTYGLSMDPIASSTLTNLNTGEAQSNTISLAVVDGVASLKVNDVLVPGMDVSAYQGSGDVGIAIGTQKGDEVDGKTTLFKDFTLWNIP
jgi:hypothetical protein